MRLVRLVFKDEVDLGLPAYAFAPGQFDEEMLRAVVQDGLYGVEPQVVEMELLK